MKILRLIEAVLSFILFFFYFEPSNYRQVYLIAFSYVDSIEGHKAKETMQSIILIATRRIIFFFFIRLILYTYFLILSVFCFLFFFFLRILKKEKKNSILLLSNESVRRGKQIEIAQNL